MTIIWCQSVVPAGVVAAGTGIPAHQVADFDGTYFNGIISGSAREDFNTDGSIGWLSFGATILQLTYNFPYSGQYYFTIPAYYLVDGSANSNGLQVFVDQIPALTIGASAGNDFIHFVHTPIPATNYVFSAFVLAGQHSILIRMQYAGPVTGGIQGQLHIERLLISTTGVSYPIEPPGTRDASLYPMTSYSLWNQPITSGAVWSGAGDADTLQITTATGIINGSNFSIPVYQGISSDPASTWQDVDNELTPDITIPGPLRTLKAPAGMAVALPLSGGDHNIAVSDAANVRYAYIGFNGAVSGQAVTVGRGKYLDNYNVNPGMAQDEADYLGLIRVSELTAGVMNHQLIYGLATQLVLAGPSQLSGLAWPACESDAGGPFGGYTGNVLYGSKVGIPSTASMPGGLTASGTALWNTLKTFGASMNVTGGQPANQITLYAEVAAEGMSELTDMRTDFATIVPFLRIMRNHTQATPNGGGSPLVSLLPGLTPGLPMIAP